MRALHLLPFALLAPACAAPTFETPEEIAELCADRGQQQLTFDVFFNDREGCTWDGDGNLPAEQGIYAAREHERSLVEEVADTVLCTLDLDFADGFQFEDDFFLTWNDVVLVANRSSATEEFQEWRRFPVFEWDDLVELEVPDNPGGSFCAGEDDGDADCEVPRKRMNGTWDGDLVYEPDPALVHELAFRVQAFGQLEIGLVTTGDNDDDDCGHTELDLEVTGTGVTF
jgi:hypothetical protein